MKQCSRCKEQKPDNQMKLGRSKMCLICIDALKRETQRAFRENQRMENRWFLWRCLLEHHCETCGEDDPVVLDFDHINPKEKSFTISHGINKKLDELRSEIKKCRILCANCHRRHTAKQFNHHRHLFKMLNLK